MLIKDRSARFELSSLFYRRRETKRERWMRARKSRSARAPSPRSKHPPLWVQGEGQRAPSQGQATLHSVTRISVRARHPPPLQLPPPPKKKVRRVMVEEKKIPGKKKKKNGEKRRKKTTPGPPSSPRHGVFWGAPQQARVMR